MLIDTHVHIDVEKFSADREAVIAAARSNGVSQMVVPGIEASGWAQLNEVCQQHEGLFPALGYHPLYLPDDPYAATKQLQQAIEHYCPIAIGEIGLDFWERGTPREPQLLMFENQLELACEHGLPVLLHVRKAHDQVLSLIRMSGVAGGIAHAYGGSLQQAEHYIELGFKLGIGGMVTYPRSTRLHALVQQLPLEALVLETDAPDMSPVAHQGERNSPAYLPQVVEKIAELRGIEPEEVARVTSKTAQQLLNLPLN